MADDDDREVEFWRKRKHAKHQAESIAKRKAQNIPTRDDLNRVGYYVLLLTILEAERRGEVERAQRMRRRTGLLLGDAGFDPETALPLVDEHVRTSVKDVTSWVTGRRTARRQAALRAEQSAAE